MKTANVGSSMPLSITRVWWDNQVNNAEVICGVLRYGQKNLQQLAIVGTLVAHFFEQTPTVGIR